VLRNRAFGASADVLEHERQRLVQREDRDQIGHVAEAGGFVERHAQPGRGYHAQVDLARPCRVYNARQCPPLHLDTERVEEVLVHDPVTEPAQRIGQDDRAVVGPLGDAPQAIRTVVHSVHACHDRKQHLRGADVARRLFAANVLLACLERHAESGVAIAVPRHADDAARHVPLVLILRGEEGGMRAAVPDRHAESLAVADGDVSAPFTRRHQQREREEVGGRGHQRLGPVGRGAQCAEVPQTAIGGGILHQAADDPRPELELLRRLHLHRDASRLRARHDHGDRLRMTIGIDQIDRAVMPGRHGMRERHCLGGRGGLVEQ
jgi:hypothetical protein